MNFNILGSELINFGLDFEETAIKPKMNLLKRIPDPDD